MRIPLRYQITEYDCGPTTLINAISYLFSTKELNPDIIHAVYTYCNDGFNKKGEKGKTGTSCFCMEFMANWINMYRMQRGLPMNAQFRQHENVTIEKDGDIIACLRRGGCVLVRCLLNVGHYILLTGADDEADNIYAFDPYYLEKPLRRRDIKFISDCPEKYNRIISRARLAMDGRDYYNLGPIEKREAILFERTDGGRRDE